MVFSLSREGLQAAARGTVQSISLPPDDARFIMFPESKFYSREQSFVSVHFSVELKFPFIIIY